ncbi:MAG: hypothetical protein AUI14_26610 [Actinobacteria bacterium 13_2_20CM_2_71_6]|nr:MAG: hypothetical protein AUI14_26610 [Actinobacteria bacterium 13_2_20CM_2_71_6]
MRIRSVLGRVGAVLGLVLAILVLFPAAAMACGISYEDTTGSPTAGCSAAASLTGIAVVGGLGIAVAAALAVASFRRGAMSATGLAVLLEQLSVAGTLGDTVTLVDGTQLTLLDDAGRAVVMTYASNVSANSKTRECDQLGAEYDYQRAVCGDTEYDISPPDVRETWADGLDFRRGFAQDAKYRNPDGGPSFYDPSSLPAGLRAYAIRDMDRRLMKYAAAIADPSNPLRALEVVTNDLGVAQFIRERMLALRIMGFIRVET